MLLLTNMYQLHMLAGNKTPIHSSHFNLKNSQFTRNHIILVRDLMFRIRVLQLKFNIRMLNQLLMSIFLKIINLNNSQFIRTHVKVILVRDLIFHIKDIQLRQIIRMLRQLLVSIFLRITNYKEGLKLSSNILNLFHKVKVIHLEV